MKTMDESVRGYYYQSPVPGPGRRARLDGPESATGIALSRVACLSVMVVPAREPASLGTSHEPARPYNSRVRRTLQITFL